MLRFIRCFKAALRGRNTHRKQSKHRAGQPGDAAISSVSWQDKLLKPDLEANLRQIKAILDKCSDVVYREFVFAQNDRIRIALVYTDGLVDTTQVSNQIMRALSLEVPVAAPSKEITKASALEFIKKRGLCINQIKETDRLEDIIPAILSGDTVLLVDGHSTAIINGARGWDARQISDP